MLTEERHRFIRQALDKMSIIQLQEISEQLNVSESTIRRDFAALEEKGVLILSLIHISEPTRPY